MPFGLSLRWMVSAGWWWRCPLVAVCAGVLVLLGVSFFRPLGERPGLLLHPGNVPVDWSMSLARGVWCYRREEPPLLAGQVRMWEAQRDDGDPFGPWHRNASMWKVHYERRVLPGKVLDVRVPVWPLGLVSAGVLVWLAWRGLDRAKRRRLRLCTGCGYPLSPAGLCSECGVEGVSGQRL